MPIYEYLCDDCGYDFEQLQSLNDEPLRICPECRGSVRRVISPVGVIFKGSGWYITDSRRQIGSGAGTAPPRRSTSPDKGAADGDAAARPAVEEPAAAKPGDDKPGPSASAKGD